MATELPTNRLKRPYPSSKTLVHPHKKHKSHSHADPSTTTTPTNTAINPLKRRLRSLRRLLSSSSNLPATIRIEHEREVQSLQTDLKEAEDAAQRKEEERRRSKMIGRYHRVRFFERRKAERRLKGLEKMVGSDGDAVEGSRGRRRKMHDARVDLQYTLCYPLDEAYISLFAGEAKSKLVSADGSSQSPEADSGASEDDAHEHMTTVTSATEKPKMWYLVEEAMEQGQAALDALRDGRWKDRYQDVDAEKSTAARVKKPDKTITKAKKPNPAKEMVKGSPNGIANGSAAAKPTGFIKVAQGDIVRDTTGMNRRERRKGIKKRLPAAEGRDRDEGLDDDENGVGFFE